MHAVHHSCMCTHGHDFFKCISVYIPSCVLQDMQNASLKEALDKLDSTPELNYLTQIMFMMYEDTRQPPDSPARFEVQVLYSPGVQYRERFLSGVGGQGHNPLQSPDQELATARTCNSEVPPAKVPSSPSSPIDCVQAGNYPVCF